MTTSRLIRGEPLSNSAGRAVIVAVTVFYPMIVLPLGFAVFFGISRLLAAFVFASPPLPFRLFAYWGIAIGVVCSAINAWRVRQPLVELFRRSA